MVNLSSLFAGANPNRFFEVYGFVGPQLSVAKSANVVYTYDGNTGERTGVSTSGEAKAKARIGASAGLGLKFNLNNKWAIDVEALSLIHISEPTRQAEISYAVFCLKKKKKKTPIQ